MGLSLKGAVAAIRANEPVPTEGGDWMHTGWRVTPWWHPRRYLGGNMRAWVWDNYTIAGDYDGQWYYRSFGEHAREVLKEEANG